MVKAVALGRGRVLYRDGGAAGAGVPPLPHLPERQLQLGHRDAAGRSWSQRLDPEEGAQRLVNLMTAWRHEIKEMMGGMGINSIEALRGNRLMLCGVGMTEKELEILGIRHAGE